MDQLITQLRNENSLPFLDTLITNVIDYLEFDIYLKTSNDSLLHNE